MDFNRKISTALNNPNDWFHCEKCSNIFPVKASEIVLHIRCPLCKSEDIKTFKEIEDSKK